MLSFEELTHPPVEAEVTNMVKMGICERMWKMDQRGEGPLAVSHVSQYYQYCKDTHSSWQPQQHLELTSLLGTLTGTHLLVFTSLIFSLYVKHFVCMPTFCSSCCYCN